MSKTSQPGELSRRRLADLCESERAFLLGLARGILHDTHAAEDACQQAFARACEPRTTPPDPARLRPWLARVVVNESLQTLRRQKLERRIRTQSPVAEEAGRPPDADPFLRAAVLAALEQLPEQTRLVVLLRIMQGISGNAVKELLGCSAPEVSRRLYLGMEQLRELLAHLRVDSARDHSHGP